MQFLSNAFFIVDTSDLNALKAARMHLGWPEEPTKKEIRRHCKMVIPQPAELEQRVEAVMKAFLHVKDVNGVRLYTPRMLQEWLVQRVHIRRGCLSDPVSAGGVLYRQLSSEHLGGSKAPQTKLNVWQSLRGSSQLEGFHPHQAKWVTGTRVSPELFQAQSMLGLIQWNWRRSVQNRNLNLATVCDPSLVVALNEACISEYGEPKYPDFKCSSANTGELFGIEYSQHNHFDISDSSEEDKVHVKVHCPEEDCVDMITEKELQSLINNSIDCPQSIKEQPDIIIETTSAVGSLSASPSAVSLENSSDKTPIESQKKTLRSKQDIRQPALSGTIRPWHPGTWSKEMKDIINDLLASSQNKKDKHNFVLKEYLKILYASASNPTSKLKYTNQRFIQTYERQMNRTLEGNAAINEDVDQANAITVLSDELSKTKDIQGKIIVPESSQRPNIPFVNPVTEAVKSSQAGKRPFGVSEISQQKQATHHPFAKQFLDTMATMQNCAAALVASFETSMNQSQNPVTPQLDALVSVPGPSPPKKQQLSKNETGRKCKYCGGYKSQLKGERNLHATFVKKGQIGYFYCPKKVKDLYGVSDSTTFEEFKQTDFWRVEQEKAIEKKQELARKKEEAAARPEQYNWKKPGNPKGYKYK